MKCISTREFYNRNLLGELSTGARPLTYHTVIKKVRQHIATGNDAEIIEVGEGNAVRYAIPVHNIAVLKEWIEAQYN